MGHIAARGSADPQTILAGMAYGTVVASLELEDFSLDKLSRISRADIDARLEEFLGMMKVR